MSARASVIASIRRSLGVTGAEATRRRAVTDRLAGHPPGVVPARGQGGAEAQLALFIRMAKASSASVEQVSDIADIPAAIVAFLRQHNLPMSVRRGDDPLLAGLPWESAGALDVTTGPSDGHQLASVSHAFAAVAETGTLVLISGRNNPTTLNFLPDNHVVVVEAGDLVGDYESVWRRLREAFGTGVLPRTVNMITGPSRSADIEQTLLLGAHGPRRLHVLVVGRN
ncbi:MAG TPA: lactate utilization protein [Xanthobacteraceae bacterium]|nr:lactate utilization protein [Xanthobacteraceae bacterium]